MQNEQSIVQPGAVGIRPFGEFFFATNNLGKSAAVLYCGLPAKLLLFGKANSIQNRPSVEGHLASSSKRQRIMKSLNEYRSSWSKCLNYLSSSLCFLLGGSLLTISQFTHWSSGQLCEEQPKDGFGSYSCTINKPCLVVTLRSKKKVETHRLKNWKIPSLKLTASLPLKINGRGIMKFPFGIIFQNQTLSFREGYFQDCKRHNATENSTVSIAFCSSRPPNRSHNCYLVHHIHPAPPRP